MAAEKLCFKDYMKCKDDKLLSKTRKKMNRKRKDGSSKNVYGWAGYGAPPNLSGAPVGGADGGADGGGGMGESYEMAATDNTRDIKNVYNYGRRGMKFLDYLNSENEEDFNPDIDPEEPVGDDPEGSDEEFDDDIYDFIKELQADGMDNEEIADETNLSVEEIEAYIDHYADKDSEDDYSELDFDKDNYDLGDEEDYDEEDEEDLDPDDEEDDYDNILAAFDRNRHRGRAVDDFVGADQSKFERGIDPYADDDYPEDEEDVDPDEDPDEYERRYDVDPDEDDDEDYNDDEPEYADEVKVGDWTIRRLDDEEDDFNDDEYSDDEYSDDEYSDDEYSDDEYSDDEEDYEYAEDAEEPSQKDQARALYRAMKSGEYTRQDIISAFEKRLGLSSSSATAYYQRIAKEYGETDPTGDQDQNGVPRGMGMGQMPGVGMMDDQQMQGQEEPEYQDPQEWEDPHRQGVIRTVKGAHLVYKRQADDGSFEELWLYKEGDKFQDELSVRHDILAGTDIPVNKTQSPDGSQKAETWAVGDVQYLHITGLPN